MHGSEIRLEQRGGKSNVGYWLDPSEYVTWSVEAKTSARYNVKITYACPHDSACKLTVDGQELSATLSSTGNYGTFESRTVGTIELSAGEKSTITAYRTEDKGPFNLRELELTPAE